MQVKSTNAVFLRADPSTDNPPITLIPVNTIIDAATSHSWRLVTVDGQTGWMAQEYLADVPLIEDTGEETQYSLDTLWPFFTEAGGSYGIDPRFVAGVAYQESGFKNYRVHRDGTGHGLFGLDDNGMLPAFETWASMSIGRGPSAAIIPVIAQISYASYALAAYLSRYGSLDLAAAAWHRGEGQMHDARGTAYAQLIRAHMASLPYPS